MAPGKLSTSQSMRYSSSMMERNMRMSALLWFFLHKILHASGTFISISYLHRELKGKHTHGQSGYMGKFVCAL